MPTTPRVPRARIARVIEWPRHQLFRLNQRLVPAPAAIMEMIIATWMSQAVTVAAQLGIADALADGPLTNDQLAERVDADPDALHRLPRAVVGRGGFPRRRGRRIQMKFPCPTPRFG